MALAVAAVVLILLIAAALLLGKQKVALRSLAPANRALASAAVPEQRGPTVR
jgi:hypothetical protein